MNIAGLHFIVESDITKTRFSLDRAGRSILVILRHCSRIREVRGGGFTRYCICWPYGPDPTLTYCIVCRVFADINDDHMIQKCKIDKWNAQWSA